MTPFPGFPGGKVQQTPVPALFFSELLSEIDHLGELKVTLYAFWRLDRTEGIFRYLMRNDFVGDASFMRGMGSSPQEAEAVLGEALKRAVERGILLKTSVLLEDGDEILYFLNSPKGRAAIKAIARGEWRHSADERMPVELELDAPNVFKLYEEHIGPITPMIADTLGDAEDTYPAKWIEDAIRIAVENNVRNWRYVAAILNRWQEVGRDERKDRRDTEKARRRYAEWED